MNLQRLLYGKYSKVILSIILGFGLATFFRKACNSRKCHNFVTPDMKKVVNETYEFDGKFYKFIPKSKRCSTDKKVIPFA
tara:strand:+ start:18460 stop:18699 length:240 start_codon:yes stop_codon:yes gene_type:complete